MPAKPLVYTVAALAAASPFILHEHRMPDCNPQLALCPPSDALFLPDGHEPERAPVIYHTPLVAVTSAAVAPGAPLVLLINRPGTSS
jgi:hypothetical protein